MAEKYEDYEEEYVEEQDSQQEEDLGLDNIYHSGGGPNWLVVFLILGLTITAGWEWLKISSLKTEVAKLSNEKFGSDQTVSDQKSKLSTRDQTISQLETQIAGLEKQLADAKSRVSSAEGRVSSNTGEADDLRNKLSAAQSEIEKLKAAPAPVPVTSSDFDTLVKAEDLKVVTFRGGKAFPQGQGKLLWSQKLGVIYLNVLNLAKNSEDKEYQLWANEGDKFFKVGLFTIGDGNNAFIKLAAPGELATKKVSDFVVTLEKKGGAEKVARRYFLTGSLFQ